MDIHCVLAWDRVVKDSSIQTKKFLMELMVKDVVGTRTSITQIFSHTHFVVHYYKNHFQRRFFVAFNDSFQPSLNPPS